MSITVSLIEKLKGSYRKFKSQVYFQNSLSYKKKEIALFENQSDSFENAFVELEAAISSKNMDYFKTLFQKIDTFIVPKKINEKSNDTSLIENRNVDERVEINEVNFHFDSPIEINILDVFYTIEVASFLNSKRVLQNEYWYANKFHRDLFDYNSEPNYKNLNIHTYYFSQYKKWKNDAIYCSEKLYNSKKDSSIISLDITGYYYFVDADIEKILFNHGITLPDELTFLTKVMQEMFHYYSALVALYRIDLKGKVFLPIGLNVSYLFANLYLSSFDESVNKICSHYGRYVDDIILVIDNCNYTNLKQFANDYPQIFKVDVGGDVVLTNFPSLRIKKDKFRIIRNFHDGSSEIFTRLKTEERTISEYNLFPSFSANINSIINDIYEKQEYIKFRDFHKIQVDQSKIGKTINGLITATKGTKIQNKASFNRYSNNLLEALSPSAIVLTCMKMEKLLLLFGYLENMRAFNKVKSKIRKTIKHIKFLPNDYTKTMYGDGRSKNKKVLEERIKKSLQFLFENALCCFGALTGNTRIAKDISPLVVQMYRFSNLFDLAPVRYPLINFTNLTKSNFDYRIINFQLFVDATMQGYNSFQIQYSPYYLNLNDYLWAMETSELVTKGKYDIEALYNSYYEKIGIYFDSHKVELAFNVDQNNRYKLTTITIKNNPLFFNISTDTNNIAIAVGSINLDMMDITYKEKKKRNPKILLNTKDLGSDVKSAVIRLLNDSYYRDFKKNRENLKKVNIQGPVEQGASENTENEKRPVDYILFPESFLPLPWIKLIDKFSRETLTTIVTGIRYVVYKGTVFNLVATEIPYFDQNMHKQSLIVIRDKNIMPLKERNVLHDSGYLIKEKDIYDYVLFKKDNVNFAPLICYEATDIDARSLFKNKTNYIFTIAFNQDVNYFNSIGMSTSRDLFCFYIECNSSKYGSTAYAPYKTKYIPIASDKGNAREHMQIVFTNLNALNEYKNGYFEALGKYDSYDFTDDDPSAKPDKKKAMFKKPSAGLVK